MMTQEEFSDWLGLQDWIPRTSRGTTSSAQDDWLVALQIAAKKKFLEKGLPTKKDERWKYTDVTHLTKQKYTAPLTSKAEVNRYQLQGSAIQLTMINGVYAPELSSKTLLPENVTLTNMQDALQKHPALLQKYLATASGKQHAFANLNLAALTDGIVLHVPKNVRVETVIHLLFINTEQSNFTQHSRHLLLLDEMSEATVFEEHLHVNANNYFTNSVMEVELKPGARFSHIKIQNDAPDATHIAQLHISQQQDSHAQVCSLAVGAKTGREDVIVNLKEKGASCDLNGFYYLNMDEQTLDQYSYVEHQAPHGVSNMFYKGIINKKSRAVFNGKVYVCPGAVKTQAYQANHNLNLSAQGEVNTKPEFEIYADDVKCSHGDTVGQLDNDVLFYLRSRGIDKKSALQLLTEAYAKEVFQKVTHAEIKHRMMALLKAKMEHTHDS